MIGAFMGEIKGSDYALHRKNAETALLINFNLVPTDAMLKQRITLPSSVASWVAAKYATANMSRLNRPMSVDEISADPLLDQIVAQQSPGSSRIGGGGGSGFGAKDLIGPAAGAAFFYFALNRRPVWAMVGAVFGYWVGQSIKKKGITY